MLNFRKKLPHQEQGFTLVEVLVAILITTVFVATAMQAVVIAAVFKARAKQFSEATNWIQEDLESVRQQATSLGSTTLSAVPTTNSLSVSSAAGFAVGNKLQIDTIGTTFFTISSLSGNTTITVSPALTSAQISATPAGTPVSVVTTSSTDPTLCYANVSTGSTSGFGNFLSNNLPTLDSTNNTKTITGTTYTLSRNTTINNDDFKVLKITYSVAENTNPAIATLNTEVIPKAALQCPPF